MSKRSWNLMTHEVSVESDIITITDKERNIQILFGIETILEINWIIIKSNALILTIVSKHNTTSEPRTEEFIIMKSENQALLLELGSLINEIKQKVQAEQIEIKMEKYGPRKCIDDKGFTCNPTQKPPQQNTRLSVRPCISYSKSASETSDEYERMKPQFTNMEVRHGINTDFEYVKFSNVNDLIDNMKKHSQTSCQYVLIKRKSTDDSENMFVYALNRMNLGVSNHDLILKKANVVYSALSNSHNETRVTPMAECVFELNHPGMNPDLDKYQIAVTTDYILFKNFSSYEEIISMLKFIFF